MQTPTSQGLRRTSPPESVPVRIVLIYEDLDMAIRGKRVCDIFAREVAGNSSQTDLSVWRFDLLHRSEISRLAAHRAEKADAVVVAPRDWNKLPFPIKEWLEKWPASRNASGALIALSHPGTVATARSCNDALLLWRAAERARMDLFCKFESRLPWNSTRALPEKTQH